MPTENPITKIPQKKLSKRTLRKLAAFISPADVVEMMDKSEWSVEKSIGALVEIAKSSDSDSARITAIRLLNQIVVDAMTRSGLIAMATHTIHGEGGERLQFSGTIVQSVLQGQQDHTTIDQLTQVPDKEQNNEQRTRPSSPRDTSGGGGDSPDSGGIQVGTGTGPNDPVSAPAPVGEPETRESGQTETPEDKPSTEGEDEAGTDKSQGEAGGTEGGEIGSVPESGDRGTEGGDTGISTSKPPSTAAAKEHFKGIARGVAPSKTTVADFI